MRAAGGVVKTLALLLRCFDERFFFRPLVVAAAGLAAAAVVLVVAARAGTGFGMVMVSDGWLLFLF